MCENKSNVKLNDDELSNVTGGKGNSTGDVNSNGEVYFKFPGIIGSLSGFYSKESL